MHRDRAGPQDRRDSLSAVSMARAICPAGTRSALGWSAPGTVRIEGGSVGFQIGGSSTDLIMLVMNERGADKLLESRFTVGAEGSVAAGPVGRTATAQTDAQMHADILSWSLTGSVCRRRSGRRDAAPGSGRQQKHLRQSALESQHRHRQDPGPRNGDELINILNRYSAREEKHGSE